jgi:hypothetical protein
MGIGGFFLNYLKTSSMFSKTILYQFSNEIVIHQHIFLDIYENLDEFDNGTLVSKPKVSGLVNDLCNFMCNTASTVFGTNSKNRHHDKK